MPKRHRFSLRALLIRAIGILFLSGVLTSAAYSEPFSLGPTGLGAVGGNLLVATRLVNEGTKNAFAVDILSITLTPATLNTTLPISVGTVDANQNAVIQLSFGSAGLMPGEKYVLKAHGNYRLGSVRGATSQFTVSTKIVVPPVAPGEAIRKMKTAHPNRVQGGKFPHIMLQNFGDANEFGPPVPTGPFIPTTPTRTATMQESIKIGAGGADHPGVALINVDDPLKLTTGPCCSTPGIVVTIAEPSGASNGAGIIFSTANLVAAYSINGGGIFKSLDPTTIFPSGSTDPIGFCCDQIVQYASGIDRFIWLLQGSVVAGTNGSTGYRLAAASPATVKSSGGTSWTYWNLTTGFFGLTGVVDYPDMSVGENYLYLSFDEIGVGLMVARIALKEIAAGGNITVEWTNPSNGGPAYGGHVMQNSGSSAFWAGQNTTSQMLIFNWPDSSTNYFWRNVNVGSWSNTGISATAGGQDFLSKLAGFPGSSVIGATRAPGPPGTTADGLWFAWSAGTNSNFSQPHVEMVTLDASSFALVQQVQIWNSSYAYAYPALATNACTKEVGFSLEGGGGGNFENHLVGFWGDYIAYITTNSNVGTTRYGDYVTIRQDPNTHDLHGAFFDAFGYGLDKPSAGQSGTQVDVRYVQFGRKGGCG